MDCRLCYFMDPPVAASPLQTFCPAICFQTLTLFPPSSRESCPHTCEGTLPTVQCLSERQAYDTLSLTLANIFLIHGVF